MVDYRRYTKVKASTERPFFKRQRYRMPDDVMLRALKGWIAQHPAGIRSRAMTMVVEAKERADA